MRPLSCKSKHCLQRLWLLFYLFFSFLALKNDLKSQYLGWCYFWCTCLPLKLLCTSSSMWTMGRQKGVQGPAWPWRLAGVCTEVLRHQGVMRVALEVHTGPWSDVLTVTFSQVTSERRVNLLFLTHKLLDSWCRMVCHHFCSPDGKEWLESKSNSHLRLIYLSSHPRLRRDSDIIVTGCTIYRGGQRSFRSSLLLGCR